MAHLSLAVWALPAAGTPVPLPDLKAHTISPTDGDWGSVEFAYPRNGRNADLLLALADTDTDLRVEVRVRATDGRTWVKPAILLESSIDDVADTDAITVHGHFHEIELGEVVVPYAPGADQGNTLISGTAGVIARTLLAAAQGRGCLSGVTWTFTDTLDSNGVAWANTANLTLAPGQTYAAMLGTLRGYGLSEWELTAGRVLRLTNVDGKGVDRTVGATPLTLERGRDLADAPRKHSLLGAATALVSAGKDGIYALASNATAQARRGRRIESYYTFGNTTDQGTLTALTTARLATTVNGKLELSHRLVLGAGNPTPLMDFGPSDYVFSATRSGVKRRRVRQVTLKGAAGAITEVDVTVGTVIDEWAIAQQKRLDDVASGAAVVGTSTPKPDVDDGSTPATPVGLTASSLWYPTSEGIGQAQVTAAWTADADKRTVGYVVEWHYLDNALGSTWQQVPETSASTVSWSSVSPGVSIGIRVSGINKYGRTSPPSTAYTLTTPVNTTPPPVLPAPVGSAYLGLLKWDWNGKGAAGESMPGNFREAELHLSTTSNFTPHRPLLANGRLDTATSTTYRDQLAGAGELPVDPGGAYGVTWFAKWVTVDRSNLASAASAQGSAVRTEIGYGDIAFKQQGNLVEDGSFELAGSRATHLARSSSAWSMVSGGAQHGTWFARATGSVGGAVFRTLALSGKIPVTPGQQFAYRFALRGTGVNGDVSTRTRWTLSDTTRVDNTLTYTPADATGAWTAKEGGSYTAPALAESLEIVVELHPNCTAGTWDVDRVEMREMVGTLLVQDAAITNAKITDLSVGKLTAGIMSALVTISGIIRTATSGARVELDTTGLRCISSTGAILFEYNIPTSALSMVGRLLAGAGVGVGRTIIVDPNGDGGSQPAIVFYPNATQQSVRMRAMNDATPGGSSSAPQVILEVLGANGIPTGGTLQMWDSGTALYNRTTTGSAPSGGILFANNTQTYMQQGSANVVINNGDVYLHGANGRTVFVDNTDLNCSGSTRVNAPRFANNGNGANIEARSGADIFFYWASGSIQIGSNGAFVKTFVIDHPTDPDRWLVHGCVEGPEAAVEYRGVATLHDGVAVVTLPDYFEAATLPDGRTVHVTMLLPDEPGELEPPLPPMQGPAGHSGDLQLDAPPVPEHALIYPVAASLPRAGRFRIASGAPDGTEVSWLVKAVRADVPLLDPEPLRSDVDVHGDGPYRHLTPR